jgi:plasmid maintenance system antidote protein VapI
MWFQKEKFAQTIKSNNLKLAWLAQRLGCSVATVSRIANGQAAANCRVARELLRVFGYDAVIAAIDWGRTKYAS